MGLVRQRVIVRARERELGVADDGREDVVEFVDECGGECAERGEALQMGEAFLDLGEPPFYLRELIEHIRSVDEAQRVGLRVVVVQCVVVHRVGLFCAVVRRVGVGCVVVRRVGAWCVALWRAGTRRVGGGCTGVLCVGMRRVGGRRVGLRRVGVYRARVWCVV